MPKKLKKPPSDLQKAVTGRLRAVQAELGLTDQGIAERFKASRSRWSNWVTGGSMPAEEVMIEICEKEHLTLDWIYRGKPDMVPLATIIRLTARLLGIAPDDATADILNVPAAEIQAAAMAAGAAASESAASERRASKASANGEKRGSRAASKGPQKYTDRPTVSRRPKNINA